MKLNAIIKIFSILALLLTVLAGGFYYASARKTAIARSHELAAGQLSTAEEHINGLLAKYQKTAASMAVDNDIRLALQEPNPESLARADRVLDTFQSALVDGVCYLMATDGRTVAASNRNTATSFVGKEYGFRPYFKEAMQGRPALYLAVGVTSKEAGLYYSHPVYGPTADQPIGVAVIKLLPVEIQQEIEQPSFTGVVLVTGPGDIIFLTSDPELRDKALWPLSPAAATNPAITETFGAGPWTWSGMRKLSAHTALGPDGKPYMIHQEGLASQPGWHLVYLHDSQADESRAAAGLFKKAGSMTLASCLLLGVVVFFLYRGATAEIRQREQSEEKLSTLSSGLEEQVASRTGELSLVNTQLQAEIAERQETAERLEKSYKLQETLNEILKLSLAMPSLDEFLQEFIRYTTSLPELGVLPKGAILLKESPGVLTLKAHRDLAAPLLTSCRQVNFGHCLCGRAAQSGEVVFADCIDDRHDISYDGIKPHGHYCVPVLSSDKEVLGVYTVYIREGVARDQRVEEFLTAMASVLAGIIQQKQAEQEKRESEEKYRAITSTAHDAIIMMDHQGLVTYWNPAAERIFGYAASEAIGRDLHKLITPVSYHEDAYAGLAKFRKEGRGNLLGKTIEVTAVRKNSTELPVELSLSAIRLGEQWAAVGVVRDISERKQAEHDRARLQTKLRQAQKMESIGTLAGGIAHDFNNILTSILGYAELARDGMPTASEGREDLDQVIKAGLRAKNLVAQILAFSRQSEQELVPVQMPLLAKEALKLLRASLPTTIEIRQRIAVENIAVLADPTQLHQVLMNLCTNAFHAMREKGGILDVQVDTVAATEEFRALHPDLHHDAFARLTVRDTGIGMDATILPRIFDPYFSTKKKEDGTGLGLAVVHGIVRSLGGVIEVESVLGAGSEFRVFLPLAPTAAVEEEPESETLLPRGSERILLVDDELPIARLGERMLTSLDYAVTMRTSSVEALEVFRHQPDRFDLVVTDQTMPNMTGTALAAELLAIRPELPIILCTGYNDADLRERIASIGIKAFTMKPVAKNTLAHLVRMALDARKNTGT